MPMTALKFKPGIVSDITSYSNEGGFVDGDKVRFRFGFPEKFGGWEKYSPNQYLVVPEDYITGWLLIALTSWVLAHILNIILKKVRL